jgi:hypothetical protein
MKHVNVALVLSIVMIGVGCAGRPPARVSNADDRFLAGTVLRNDGEPPQSIGKKVWTKRTIEATRMLPMSEIHVDEHGNLIGFKPALPPAEGVTPPPEGAVFDRAIFKEGRLIRWQ